MRPGSLAADSPSWLPLALAVLISLVWSLPARGEEPARRFPKPYGVGVRDGAWWMLRPDGSRFWSFGVDCVAPGSDWRTIDLGNPSYAGFRLFPDGKSWVQTTLGQLRDWGFNTLGGWADIELIRWYAGDKALPYTVVLHLGAYNKAPWHDLFGKETRIAVEQAAKEQIPPLVEDPNLIGYFTDNELGWWDDTLFLHYLEMPNSAPGKQRLMRLIKDHYRGSWDSLQRDWSTPGARGFDELAERAKMLVRPGGKAMELVDAWSYVLADHYYSMVKKAVRKHDPVRMILGDRFIQSYPLAIARACGKHMDVASTNLGADWTDGGVSRFFLRALHEETRKPILITEFYMAAMENRSGNKNTGNVFPTVATQAERAEAFAKNVREYASLPFVIGAHWFQFHDEPTNGRHDGEDYNMGLVDIHGVPYDGMVQAAKSFDFEELRASFQAMPSATQPIRVPTAGPKPFEPSLKLWPREAGFVPPKTFRGAFADLYACRDAENLYLGLYVMDFADERLYEGGKMPESERAEWRIALGEGAKPIVVRFMGKERPPTVGTPGIDVVEADAIKRTVILRIPLKDLPGGQNPMPLRCKVSNHSRAETMAWDAALDLG